MPFNFHECLDAGGGGALSSLDEERADDLVVEMSTLPEVANSSFGLLKLGIFAELALSAPDGGIVEFEVVTVSEE
jgi:hypothetical protein